MEPATAVGTSNARLCPAELVEWAGHHAGGVKRLFDANSGRPTERLSTNLLGRLEEWTGRLAAGNPGTPRILLLVGGPGNGKTEAIQSTIECLDKSLGCGEKLLTQLSHEFHPASGIAVPRVVRIDAGQLAQEPRPLVLEVVQDASTTAGQSGRVAAELLIHELLTHLDGDESNVYLCCVNRGVLDDALIHAIEHELSRPRAVLEAITSAVSLSADAPSCWPMDHYPSIAVWPMDAESLLVPPDGHTESPAEVLVKRATAPARWRPTGTCAASQYCPFCGSQALLERDAPRTALLQILRWYELASGKRWSFRDLFSLLSYLLAGHRQAGEPQADPCLWAANLVRLDQQAANSSKPSKYALSAIFHLATASYQHALFHRWNKELAASLRKDAKELGLEQDRTLIGFCHFLQDRKNPYLPATIAPMLEDIAGLLDPALASPETEVALSSRTKMLLHELDVRFCRSIADGAEHIRKYQVLTPVENELLKRLAALDTLLSDSPARRRRPAVASRVQRTLRDFACRLVRRNICVRSGVVTDSEVLRAFQQIVEERQAGNRLYEVAEQVEALLNKGQDFEVSLTTTFGQPLPPPRRQAILVVPSRQVQMHPPGSAARPRSPICFLQVGAGSSTQAIALTYDLFKAIKELERGLSAASLPRSVVALLDTTRSRLSGPIVRDDDVIRRAKIRIGMDGAVVAKSWNGFVARKEKPRP